MPKKTKQIKTPLEQLHEREAKKIQEEKELLKQEKERKDRIDHHLEQAIKFIKLAAEEEDSVAETFYAILLQLGKGTKADKSEAVKWYYRAAQHDRDPLGAVNCLMRLCSEVHIPVIKLPQYSSTYDMPGMSMPQFIPQVKPYDSLMQLMMTSFQEIKKNSLGSSIPQITEALDFFIKHGFTYVGQIFDREFKTTEAQHAKANFARVYNVPIHDELKMKMTLSGIPSMYRDNANADEI